MAIPSSPLLGKSQASAPAVYAAPIVLDTPSAYPFRSLYIGVSGDVSITMADGVAIVFKAVPVGILPVSGLSVTTANTTATNIVALV